MSKIELGNSKFLYLKPKILYNELDKSEHASMDSILYDLDIEAESVSMRLYADIFNSDNSINLKSIYKFSVETNEENKEKTEIIIKNVNKTFLKHFNHEYILDFDTAMFGKYKGRFGDDIFVYQCTDMKMIMLKHTDKKGFYNRLFFNYDKSLEILEELGNIYFDLHSSNLHFYFEVNIENYDNGKNFHKLFEHSEYIVSRYADSQWEDEEFNV